MREYGKTYPPSILLGPQRVARTSHSLSHLFFRAAECNLGFSSLKSVWALMSALKMAGGTVSLEPGGCRTPSTVRHAFASAAGRHLKSMQERTCRRGTIEF